MNRRAVLSLCWWVLVVMISGCLTLALVLKRDYTGDDLLFAVWVLYAPVGAVVARRRPENPIGWVFLLVGLSASLLELSVVGVQAALVDGPPLEWWGYPSAWAQTGLGFPLIILATTFTFLLYPSGLSSPRWRPVLWLATALAVLSVAFAALSPTLWLGDEGTPKAFEVENPIAWSTPALSDNFYYLWIALLVIATLLSVASALFELGDRKGSSGCRCDSSRLRSCCSWCHSGPHNGLPLTDTRFYVLSSSRPRSHVFRSHAESRFCATACTTSTGSLVVPLPTAW